jgi:hypothetical protein
MSNKDIEEPLLISAGINDSMPNVEDNNGDGFDVMASHLFSDDEMENSLEWK